MVAEQWLTVQDVAELLQVRIETVRRWVRRGELPVLELGGPRSVYRIRPDDLDRFVWQRYRLLNETSSNAQDPEAPEPHGVNDQQPDSPRNDAQSSWIAVHGFGGDNVDANTDEQFRVLLDTVPAVTFREDASEPGSVLYVSREIEALLGYPLSEWRDQPSFWLEHVHPSDRAEVEAEFARTDATCDPFNMDYRLIAMDGRTVWIHCEAVLTPDAHGGKPVWEGVLVDITERKKIEDALGLRERQQQAVARLGQRALEEVDLSMLLDEAVVYVSRSLDVEYAKIFEVLPGGDNLILRAGVGWLEGRIGGVKTSAGQVGAMTVPSHVDSQSGYTLLSYEPVISEDLAREERFDGPRMAASMVSRVG